MCFGFFGAQKKKCHFPVTSFVWKIWINESHDNQDSLSDEDQMNITLG